jgi:NAD-dependent oxidoreductase involved in siderophore biosynthesis
MNRRSTPFTLQQAADESPTLAGLLARARDASERLRAIEELIPVEMRPAVQPGPAEGDVWCLLVTGSAAAAKLRQLSPMLVTRLKARGWDVASLRIKVQTRR